jgi:hypothetical protein
MSSSPLLLSSGSMENTFVDNLFESLFKSWRLENHTSTGYLKKPKEMMSKCVQIPEKEV